ncbi:putative non-specific serine/threonine protein kinase [Helianthus debilis subsp. tardiflorus]
MLASVGSGSSESPVIKTGNMIISVHVFKKCDQNFAKESELGYGGFGVIYKGQLDDGTKISSQNNGIWCDLQQRIR